MHELKCRVQSGEFETWIFETYSGVKAATAMRPWDWHCQGQHANESSMPTKRVSTSPRPDAARTDTRWGGGQMGGGGGGHVGGWNRFHTPNSRHKLKKGHRTSTSVTLAIIMQWGRLWPLQGGASRSLAQLHHVSRLELQSKAPPPVTETLVVSQEKSSAWCIRRHSGVPGLMPGRSGHGVGVQPSISATRCGGESIRCST